MAKQLTIWQGHVCINMQASDKLGAKHRRLYTPCGWYCVSSLETYEGTIDKVKCDTCRTVTEKRKC